VPQRISPEIVRPGTIAGPLRVPGTTDDRASAVRVIVSASHDTAAAVAAIPLGGLEDAYISSGTWSLVGVETSTPSLTAEARALRVTNEAGVGGTYRLLRNVMGLWLVQGLQESLAERRITAPIEGLIEAADRAGPARSWIDPDDRGLLHPQDMAKAIQTACRVSGQPVPAQPGELVRVVLESLALRYRWAIEGLERLTGTPIGTLHIVGGGARNDLLCRLTADATGRPVIVGPVEAAAIGNVLVQLTATGSLDSTAEGRELVARSIPRRRIEPARDSRWDEAYARFVNLPATEGVGT
jgi:rhamnulokinase